VFNFFAGISAASSSLPQPPMQQKMGFSQFWVTKKILKKN